MVLTMNATRDSLFADLRAMGVRSGDALIVHSSFKSLGGVEGGPRAVVEALRQAVGDDGLLLMPTFTFAGKGRFSVAKSHSQTGAVTEFFRLSDGVARSPHPTHSCGITGPGADDIALAHETTSGLGVGSPFHLVAQRDAKVLLIGVDSGRNSLIHVAEALAAQPYVDEVFWGQPTTPKTLPSIAVEYPDGRVVQRELVQTPGCAKGFHVVDEELDRRDKLVRPVFGRASTLLMKADDVIAVARDMIAKNRAALLCDEPACRFCPHARACLERHEMI